MRSYKNTTSLTKIVDLCRIGKSTIDKVFYWVIIAIQSSNLRTIHVRWPAKLE